jgi:hypothetical protein
LQRIEKLDPKARRQVTQILDTFIEREELKQRIDSQETHLTTIQIELPDATAQAAREAGLLTPQALERLLNDALRRKQAAELPDDPLFGMWRDREDMADVGAYIRRIRASRFNRDDSLNEP